MTTGQTEIIEGFRLSPQQRHLWRLREADRGLPCRVQGTVLIEGYLDNKAFTDALNEVFARHDILRTTFQRLATNDIPVQIVAAREPPAINQHDLRAYSPVEQQQRIEAIFQDLSRHPFDLARGPLSRIHLISLAPSRHLLLISQSAFCADAISLATLVRDLGRYYSTRLSRNELLRPALQYPDLAQWLNELLESEDARPGKQYWRKQFAHASSLALTLPLEKPRAAGSSFDPQCWTFAVQPGVVAAIETVATRYRTSLSTLLLACWQTLLWRLTGQAEISVGMVCDGRTYDELQPSLGPFARLLPLHGHLAAGLPFDRLLPHIDMIASDMREWQDYCDCGDGEHFGESSGATESFAFSTAAFEYNEQRDKCSFDGLTLSFEQLYSFADRFTIKLSCLKSSSHLNAGLLYDLNSFSRPDIERMAMQFSTLLQSVAGNPEAEIGELDILSGADRRELLIDFNATEGDYPRDKCVHQLFEDQVERTPTKIAIAFEQRRLTYAQLNQRANQVAHHLRTLDVAPNVLVALCVERGIEMVVGLLGILKAGGAYVPLDPFGPKERLFFMLRDIGASVLLTQQHLLARIPAHSGHTLCLDSGWNAIAKNSESNPINMATVRDPAYVIHTSGSTGQPKGVIVEHRGLTNTVHWIMDTLELSSDDSSLLKTPITFDAAGREVFPTLLAGGVLVIAEPDRQGDVRYLSEMIRSERISILHCVPSLLRLLIEEPAFDDIPTLRAVMCGGEALPGQLVARVQSRCGTKLYNVYGPTEASIDTAFWLCEWGGARSSIPIGRPIPNSTIYILDGLLRPVPIGVPGELHIGGVGLARGYLNRFDLTAEKFIPDPFGAQPGSRLYKTGDLARYLPDGVIEFLGRVDHQVKIRGFRIELGEIETALVRHPAVDEAAVAALEDSSGEKRLVAYLTTKPDHQIAMEGLRGFLKNKLPDYMVPAIFVPLEIMPLMPNGKIDRRALPAPDPTQPETHGPFVASRTPTEELIVHIWAHVLGVERIGINDNFFDLGGHSLLATQVVSRLREAFEVDIPLRRIFELPTVAGLAESIEFTRRAGHKLAAQPIPPVPRDGDLPLSFAQQRLWFIGQLDPGNSAYNFPAAIRLTGPLDRTALEFSLNEIVKRHEVLRTTFVTVNGRPTQVIAPTSAVILALADLRELSPVERDNEVQRLAIEEARRPFDLAKGPLLRASLLCLGEEEYVGLLTMHHIVADGWSTGVLIREMAVIYQAAVAGKASPLPDLPIQYADFAHWQRRWLQGDVLDLQLGYWKRQLSGAAPLELSTDYPRRSMQTFCGAHQTFVLPGGVVAGLKTLSRRQGVTIFMSLMAAFNALLHRYTGQDDVLVGTPIANRNRLEIEGLIGFFVNTLVLRTDLSGNPSFKELLRRVRDVCLSAYVHQDLPFERLVEELHLERDVSRNPLFQVMFVLRNASGQAIELPGLTLTSLEVDHGTTHFDLILHMTETEQGLSGDLVYNTDLFAPASVTRMLDHFRILLSALVADPEQKVSDVPLPAEAATSQSLVAWDTEHCDDPTDSAVHQLFAAQAELTPDAVAVVFEDQQLTYRALNRRSNQLAHHLKALGVGPEVTVAICLDRSLEAIVGLLGVLKAGGVYVPLDPAYPKERLSFMLEDAKVAVLLTAERLSAGLPAHDAHVICLDSGWKAIELESAENPDNLTEADNLAYVIYTSGSTGMPKGVLISHGAIAQHCRDISRYYELDPHDRVLHFASMSFDLSLEQILPTLVAGAGLVMWRVDFENAIDFYRRISTFGLTVLNLPTAYWQELARSWADHPVLDSNNQLRLVIVGGDTLSPDALLRWSRTPLSSLRLLNAYGPTEATITATAFELSPRLSESAALHRIPIGRPLANRRTYILDKHGNPVPVGATGELYIGGANLARGYLNQPDLTAEKFVPDPFSRRPGARLYKSGDRARYLSDGNLEFVGRIDDQVKLRGFRIEPAEIEGALRRCPAVRSAVVMLRADPPAEKRLVAYVVAERASVTAADLRHFLKDQVPEYMVPAAFVMLHALPLMANGKIDRRALPVAEQERSDLKNTFVAPRNELELALTQIWAEVLGVDAVGVTDNFFELGGHSLLAVRLFALLESKLEKTLPLATLFLGPTVEQLARVLSQDAKPSIPSPLVALQPAGTKRPLFMVHPAGGQVFPYVHLAKCLGLDQPCYGLQAESRDDEQEPQTRIEDMASSYIEALQTVQLEGPYLLGGWSMGGVVAFEMARQLRAQGQQVALLALLDARLPTSDDRYSEDTFEATLLGDVVRYFGLPLDLQLMSQYSQDQMLIQVLEQAKKAGLVPSEIEASKASRFVELLKTDFRATRNYVIQTYPGRVTLLKAREELSSASLEQDLGWGRWAAGGVEVHVVPGNHANMVYQPYVEVLAERLRTCISLADSPGRGSHEIDFSTSLQVAK